jgi:hypothetical protein
MGVWEQNPARARIKIDGGGSATAFGAVAGARWVLQGAAFGWRNAASSITVCLMEHDSTNSTTFLCFATSATNGFQSFFLGEHGIQASSSYSSRMALNVGAITGTFTALFTGYYT